MEIPTGIRIAEKGRALVAVFNHETQEENDALSIWFLKEGTSGTEVSVCGF